MTDFLGGLLLVACAIVLSALTMLILSLLAFIVGRWLKWSCK